eukprot:3524153-Prymnesium_polylepis.1
MHDNVRGHAQEGRLPRHAARCGAHARAPPGGLPGWPQQLRDRGRRESATGSDRAQDEADALTGARACRGRGLAALHAAERQGRGVSGVAHRARARPDGHRGVRLLPAAALPRHPGLRHTQYPPVAAAALSRCRAGAALPRDGRCDHRRQRGVHCAQDGLGADPPAGGAAAQRR